VGSWSCIRETRDPARKNRKNIGVQGTEEKEVKVRGIKKKNMTAAGRKVGNWQGR